MGGFDTLEEAFGPYAKQIYAVETGLSSNPSMNWQIKELDNRTILSFSDAHSGPKLGREATVFEIPDGNLSYDAVYEAITTRTGNGGQNLFDPLRAGQSNIGTSLQSTDGTGSDSPVVKHGKRSAQILSPVASEQNGSLKSNIAYTIEFYPEEGKYHYTGHRACNIRWGPDETRKNGTQCPVCGKTLTQGVMQRVGELMGRSEKDLELSVVGCTLSDDGPEVVMTRSNAFPNRPPFVMLVPLQEIIHEAIGSPVLSKKTQAVYTKLIEVFGNEFTVLLHTKKEYIAEVAGERVAEGIEKVRTGNIVIDPGYDGVFGIVKIWKKDGDKGLVDESKQQIGLF